MIGLDEYGVLAERAVDIAEALFQSEFGNPGSLRTKGDRDFATYTDNAIEERVKEFLLNETPDIGFLGEEEGSFLALDQSTKTDLQWILDPIDGTVNYAAGSPLCGISLALAKGDEPLLGVISLPLFGERYRGSINRRATCNGIPIRAASVEAIDKCLVAFGDFATGEDADLKNEERKQLSSLLVDQVLRIRMLGSAAVDMAWLASGRHHVVVSLSNHPWDYAAGVAIARAAGASVGDVPGGRYSLDSGAMIGISDEAVVGQIREVFARVRLRNSSST